MKFHKKKREKILSFEKMYISLQREELFDILNNENCVRAKCGHLVASASILAVVRTLSWKTIYSSGLWFGGNPFNGESYFIGDR